MHPAQDNPIGEIRSSLNTLGDQLYAWTRVRASHDKPPLSCYDNDLQVCHHSPNSPVLAS